MKSMKEEMNKLIYLRIKEHVHEEIKNKSHIETTCITVAKRVGKIIQDKDRKFKR